MLFDISNSDWGVCELWWCLLIYIVAAAILYVAAVRLGWYRGTALSSNPSSSRVLFVTAHPDDESMFFGPSILALTEQNPSSVHLLCLSRGDYRQEGHMRVDELWKSCSLLGIPQENVLLIHSSCFPDDPTVQWDSAKLALLLLNHIISLDISVIVSFDEDGVSGHSNHRAVNRALGRLTVKRQLPSGCRAFALDSVGILRKYSGPLDIVPSMLFDGLVHVSPWARRRRAVQAMNAHASQMVWFRRLYLLVSRYMLINTFTEISDDFSLEME